MAQFSRRTFLLQASTTVLCATASSSHSLFANALPLHSEQSGALSMDNISRWNSFGRLEMSHQGDTLTLCEGYVSSSQKLSDLSFTVTARAPKHAKEVQIWAGLRCRDRDSRYIFGLRGGNNDHLYFARYAPEGNTSFLGIAPLNFHPEPGQWYTIRALAKGNQFQIYLDDEKLPRLQAVDLEPLWQEGGVVLGGGWVPAEYRDIQFNALHPVEAAAFDAVGNKVFTFDGFNRQERRKQQRTTYQPKKINTIHATRSEISLDGDWLLLPDQELQPGENPEVASTNDAGWHVMHVPDFWTPTLTWLHDETGFPQLPGVSAGKGLSDRLYASELNRLDNLTFLWKETRSAWYRHHIHLPSDISHKHFQLCFDAIAKVSEVWVNGIKAGSHLGMFGEVSCDITKAVKAGANVIAVHVHGQLDSDERSDEVLGVAVTVPVTASMLRSMPHGMYPESAGGIWQPVKLVITDRIAIEEASLTPRLDGLTFEAKIRNITPEQITAQISYVIASAEDDKPLYASETYTHTIAHGGTVLEYTTPKISPKHWSPHEPNLYNLKITVKTNGRETDHHVTRFGFRTFRVDGNRLLLNENPFWLRGANHFPHAIRPNDTMLAHRFIQIAQEGNVQVTRTHTAPFTATWLEAADEVGMGVSYEGTWPWLMLEGDPPSEALLQIWKEEYLSLIRKYRNHPSILFWTVNNEMKFEMFDRNKPTLLHKKWEILSGTVKAMRDIDPIRPIVCDSSYCRREVNHEYETVIRPEGFDDGDMDDAHRYFGWYNPSFFHLFQGQFGNGLAWPDRPLISQEMATGYPRNDDGHPVRFYLYKHYTPQALAGDEAYENRDPAIFLRRQAFMTKELAEVLRRTGRDTCAGILHFAYVTWFRDVWSAEKIQPFVTYHALKKALQPVLVSAELYGRHFYAGRSISARVCIANDALDGRDLPVSTLLWEISDGNSSISRGSIDIPPIPYYSNRWINLLVPIPEKLPGTRVDALLKLSLVTTESKHSSNDYEIVLASEQWANEALPRKTALLDPFHQATGIFNGDRFHPILSIAELGDRQQLVVANAEKVLSQASVAQAIRNFVAKGGKVLLLHSGDQLPQQYPLLVKGYRAHEGEIVDMHVPESKVFDGIEVSDLCWFQRSNQQVPIACTGSFQLIPHPDAIRLATTVQIHGYLKTPQDVTSVSGAPLVLLKSGKGSILASEMFFESHEDDPIAGRLLANLVGYLYREDI